MKRHAFYSLSFQNKLLLIFLPLLFCFIIITGGICLYFSGEQLKLNTEKMMENTVHQTKILLEDKLEFHIDAKQCDRRKYCVRILYVQP